MHSGSAFYGAVQYGVKFASMLLSSFTYDAVQLKLVYIMGLTPDSNVILNVS